MIKYLLIIFMIWCQSDSTFCQILTPEDNKSQVFLYSSDLPLKLSESKFIIRKHIIDILLLTQNYNIMLSKIPEVLVKAKTPQYVLKYKLRTTGKNKYSLELFLINADQVRVERTRIRTDIKVSELTQVIRSFTYEFLLNKTPSPKQKRILNARSKRANKRIGKITEVKEPKEEKQNKATGETQKRDDSIKAPIISTNSISAKKTKNKTKVSKKSLWDLLKDDDLDIPWVPEKKIAKAKIVAEPNKKISPFFDWIKIVPTLDKYQDLEFNRFHASYKYAHRQLVINDIIDLDTEYTSVLGFAFEWMKYYPIDISRRVFKLALEFDTPLETTPVQLDGHFNLKTSLAYRLTNKYTLGVSYDIDRLNYPNLNQVGTDIVANSYTIYWLGLEAGYFHRDFNLTIGLETLLSAKNSTEETTAEDRASGDLQGKAAKFNFRYYFSDLFFDKIQFWIGFQMRIYRVSRENKIVSHSDEANTTYIEANNYLIHTGIYF